MHINAKRDWSCSSECLRMERINRRRAVKCYNPATQISAVTKDTSTTKTQHFILSGTKLETSQCCTNEIHDLSSFFFYKAQTFHLVHLSLNEWNEGLLLKICLILMFHVVTRLSRGYSMPCPTIISLTQPSLQRINTVAITNEDSSERYVCDYVLHLVYITAWWYLAPTWTRLVMVHIADRF